MYEYQLYLTSLLLVFTGHFLLVNMYTNIALLIWRNQYKRVILGTPNYVAKFIPNHI